MPDFVTYNTVLEASVANNASFDVPYIYGETASTYDANAISQMVVDNNNLFTSPAGFTTGYQATQAVVTNKTGATLPAGADIVIEFVKPETAAGGIAPGAAVANITDNTTGTASGTLATLATVPTLTDLSTGTSGGNTIGAVTNVATAANGIATLAAKLNTLLAEYVDIRNALASLAAKLNALLASLRAADFLAAEPPLTFDRFVNSATGSDGNDGLTGATAWATLAPLRTAIDALADGGSLVAHVSGAFTDDHLRLGAGVNAGVFAHIHVAEGTVFGATSGVDQSFTDSTGGAWTMRITGLGAGFTINGWNAGTGNGIGVTSNGGTRLIVENVTVTNCVDGFSIHGSNAHAEVYDFDIGVGCTKAGFAHVATGPSSVTCKRGRFGGVLPGAAVGLGAETTTASANSVYEDVEFIPASNGDAVTFLQATLRRCVVGTLALRVCTTGGAAPWGNASGPAIVEHSFIHAVWDLNSPVTMTGCYGRMTIRQRNSAVTSSLIGCVLVDGAAGAGADSLLWSGFDPGSQARIIVRNSVLRGFATALGFDYGATDTGYFSASDSRAEFLCLNGNTVNLSPAPGLAALGAPYVANNITTDPLLGPCNTTIRNDWAIGPTSPCIGAGLGGADIGFRAS